MMLRKVATALAPWIPPALGRLPYGVALAAVGRAVPDARVWARNSYLTSAFVPGVSDLDLTLWFETAPTSEALARTERALARIKRAFPALGEANVYVAGDAPLVAATINPLILDRDPTLKRKLNSARQATPAERATFLLRNLDADAANLASRPRVRARKWQAHFEAAGLEFPVREPRDFLEAIITGAAELAAPPDDRAALRERLARYYRAPAAERNTREFAARHALELLFPHRFPYLRPSSPVTADWLRELIFAQLSWEVAGLTSQFLLAGDRRQIAEHLERILGFLAEIPGSEAAGAPVRLLRDRLGSGPCNDQ